ncbi:ligand-binding sensor domain-containing diguanylate cyclase [Alteromonas lipotrueae]|uniref:ligand-binding sensor domain-containing diguanylate cyclase n=1 Tax=Alteromonas lipotrueae TaxID=2803814 RepID=UPI001C471FF0|nr:ligand-binding sensor domain-containing diguanylate cyclase [Alteromonas lipotrueae]
MLTRVFNLFRTLSVLPLFFCIPALASTSWHTLHQPTFYTPLAETSLIDGPILSVLETKDGFIWFVDSKGLWRWDSQSLKAVTFENKQSDTPSPQIQATFATNNGEVWVGTQQGLYRLHQGKLQLIAYEQSLLSDVSILHLNVTSVANNNIFTFTSDRALFIFNDATKKLLRFELPNKARIHALHVDNKHQLWVGSQHGLFHFPLVDIASSGIKHAPQLVEVGSDKQPRISSILSTASGSLVVGTADKGLFVKNVDAPFRQLAIGSTTLPWLFTMSEIKPDLLLLGTFGQGLIEVNIKTHETRQFSHNPLQPASLADDNIWFTFTDSKGLVWIGAGHTLNIFDANNHSIINIFGGANIDKSLSYRKVHSVQSHHGELFVGSGNAGIEILSPVNGKTEPLWETSENPVETLHVSKNGDVYASSNFATVKVDRVTKQGRPLAVSARSPTTFTTAFLSTGTSLWLGGTDGLWVQHNATEKQIEFADSITERRIASLAIDENRLWIGTWQGLVEGDIRMDRTINLATTHVAHPILKQQYISSLFVDDKGYLWVGTGSAGLFVNPNKADWIQIESSSGLPGDNIAAIAGESEDHIWVSTTQGIAAINRHTFVVSHAVAAPSVVNAPYAHSAAATTDENDIVFGGINGLTIIDSANFTFSKSSVPILLTDVTVVHHDDSIESLGLIATDLTVPPLIKRITFEFAALDYLTPEHTHYRYRVLGLDGNWVQANAEQRLAVITMPQPGDYTLQIEYSYDGITWEKNALHRQLVVLPAWYQTPLAKFAAILFLCVAVYIGHLLGVKHHRHRQAFLEKLVNARTAELLTANKQLSEQAAALKEASLTDPLTGLHNRRYLTQHIERDIALVQRYYDNCDQTYTVPNNDYDILFFVVDLDHFKNINDTYGHQAGDKVLIETQKRLKHIFRETDYLIRWGGEEFLVVVHNTPREEACVLAERAVDIVGSTTFQITEETRKHVTCSIGYAAYPLSQQHYNIFDWQTTIGFADTALYGAKNNRRNTWMGITSIPSSTDRKALEKVAKAPSSIFTYAQVQQPSNSQ